MKLLLIIGTRPNFIKITQFPRELEKTNKFDYKIVHTGQHFDDKMSTVFFEQFGIKPDIFLRVENGTPVFQIAEMMKQLEAVIVDYCPDLVLVVGDVNSTFAGSFVANKLGIKTAHIESGLRSFDPSMPEEWNRLLTDVMADYFFVTEESGMANLKKEGKPEDRIFFVGNTMIDTMVAFEKEIDASDVLRRLNVQPGKFVLMTMHRPATVDTKEGLMKLLDVITAVSAKYKIVFPLHPRTIKNLKSFLMYDRIEKNANLILTDPLDYFSFQKLTKECFFVLTDSGGIQEETTYLRVPCLTLRSNTERPVTVTLGSNELIPFDLDVIKEKINKIETGTYKNGERPPLWDGRATERIVRILSEQMK